MFPSVIERVIVAILLVLSIACGIAAIAFYGQRQEARKEVASLTVQKNELTESNKQLKSSLDEQTAAVASWKDAAQRAQEAADAADRVAQQKQAQYSKAAGVIAAQKPTADVLASLHDLRKTYEAQK